MGPASNPKTAPFSRALRYIVKFYFCYSLILLAVELIHIFVIFDKRTFSKVMISVEKLHLVQMERVETKKMQHDYTADFTVDIFNAIVT